MNETTRAMILGDVLGERCRQIELWGEQWEPGITHPERKLAILVEEVGEVAKEVLETGEDHALRKELVQVAAVAVAWLESLGDL